MGVVVDFQAKRRTVDVEARRSRVNDAILALTEMVNEHAWDKLGRPVSLANPAGFDDAIFTINYSILTTFRDLFSKMWELSHSGSRNLRKAELRPARLLR